MKLPRLTIFVDYCYLVILHIFVAWNGVQFIFDPGHLEYFFDESELFELLINIYHTQRFYIPFFIFFVATIFMIFIFWKNSMDIKLYIDRHKLKTGLREQFSLMVNYTIPSLFYHILNFLVLTILYSFVSGVYFFLVSHNVLSPLDEMDIIRYSGIFFFCGILFFNIWGSDFILPCIFQNKSFSRAIIMFFRFFKNNKAKIILFYLYKAFCISSSIILFQFVLRFLPERHLLANLEYDHDVIVNLFNLGKVFWGLFLSMFIYANIIFLFNLWCFNYKESLVQKYLEPRSGDFQSPPVAVISNHHP